MGATYSYVGPGCQSASPVGRPISPGAAVADDDTALARDLEDKAASGRCLLDEHIDGIFGSTLYAECPETS